MIHLEHLFQCDILIKDGYFTNKPISMIPAYFAPPSSDGIENPSFFDRASRNGTIFIYAKPSGYDPTK